jgi:hypothetical protein
LGLRLRNTSGLHLLRGPATACEGGSYAGDARITSWTCSPTGSVCSPTRSTSGLK